MASFRTISDKFLLIAFVLSISFTLILILFPVFHAIQLSFYRRESFVSEGTWVAFGNYISVLSTPMFWRAFFVGVQFALFALLLQLGLGLSFALLLNQEFYGRAAVRGLAILPYLLPTVVGRACFSMAA